MKICNVGAEKALINQFRRDKTIDVSNRVLDMNSLKKTDNRLRVKLKENFGITRPIVDYNATTEEQVVFSTDTFKEVDALHGIYYPENKNYQLDYTRNSTLTPAQFVNKYLNPSDNSIGAVFTQPAQFTSEEFSKFEIGLNMTYPNLVAEPIKYKIINGEQTYKVTLKNKPSNPIEVIVPSAPGGIDEIKNNTEYSIIENTLTPLLSKFKGTKLNWINDAEMQELLNLNGKTLISKDSVVNAVVIKNQIYLVKGKVTVDTALEELMHLFVDKLITDRKQLFIGLRNQALEQYPALAIQIETNYPKSQGFSQETRDIELVTRAIADGYKQLQENKNISNSFITSLKQFLNWLKSLLNKAFDLEITDINELPLTTTLGEMALFLDQTDVIFSNTEVIEPRFNISKLDDNNDEDEIKEEAEKSKKTIKEKKLENNKREIKLLEKLLKKYGDKNDPDNPTAPIAKSIDLLLNNAKEYRKIIEADIKTVSMTKFVGNPLHEEKEANKFQKYADFGTFIHDFLYEISIDAIENNYTPIQILNNTPNYFHDFYEDNKDKLTIPGLDEKDNKIPKIQEEVLSDQLVNVVAIINNYFVKNEVFIPEITIFEYDSMGRPVVGRLDAAIIKKDGSISVLDYKTNKSKYPLKQYTHKIIFDTKYTTKLEDGVHPAFDKFSGRSKASIFLSQIGGYERLLKRIGLNTRGSKILNIVYAPSPSRKFDLLNGEWVYKDMYVNEVNLEGEEGLSMDLDQNGNPLPKLSPMYKQVLNALRYSIIVPGETTEEEIEKKFQENINYFSSIPQSTLTIVLNNIKEQVEKQIKELDVEIASLTKNHADDSVIKLVKERRRLLFEARDWHSRQITEAGITKDYPKEIVLKGVYEKVKQIISTIKVDAEKIKKDFPEDKAINALGNRYYQLEDMKNFLVFLKNLIMKNSQIDENSEIISEINKSIDTALIGQNLYISMAGNEFKKLLLFVPKQNVESMMMQLENLYEPKIKRLNRIIAGDASVLENFTFRLKGKINKVIGKQSGTKVITNDMKEEAQKELDRINYVISKKEFNEEFVELYIENTFTNPESGFYIGSTISENGNITADEMKASLGNSELAISAMAYYAINTTQNANNAFFDRMANLKFNSFMESFANKYGGLERLNNLISEKITEKDLETGESRDYMAFIGPYSYKIHLQQDELDYAVNVLYEERKKVKNSNLPQDIKNAQLEELNKKIKKAKEDKTNWEIKNLETQLIPELYKLHASLPIDIQEVIDKINEEINNIKSRHHNEDWLLDDNSLLEIKELESQIGILRKQAILEDPALTEIYEKMNSYYEYHISEGKFDYAQRQVLKQHSEDSEEYKKWLDLNSNLIGDPKWLERVQELKAQKRALFGESDSELDALYKEKNKLMNKYRFTSQFSNVSMFNPYYMNEEDYEKFSDIEKEINKFYENKSPVELSKADKKKLNEINQELDSIVQTQNKPEYMRELNQRINEIIRINKLIGETTNIDEKAKLQAQLDIKDVEFQTWYNRNSTNKYRLGNIIKNGTVTAAPKRFNTVEMPTDPSLLIRVPNSAYRVRSLKPEAYNPNYTPSPIRKKYGRGYYSMPKGHRYNKDTGRFEVSTNAMHINPQYVTMMQDRELAEFYNRFIMDEYYNLQTDMSANKLGLYFPGVTQTSFDTISQDGLEGLKREGNEWIAKHLLANNSEFDKATNEYGISGKQRIKFSHNYRLDTTLGTKDGINAIVKWGLQYQIYNAMEDANTLLTPSIDFLKASLDNIKNETVKRQYEGVIKMLEFERNKFIYGQYYEGGKSKQDITTRKLLRQVTSLISYSRLAFDPAMQLGNMISGNVQMFLSGQGEKYGMGTYEDWAWAKSQMYGTGKFMYNIIGDWGKIDDVSLSTKISRYFNVTLNSQEKILDMSGQPISKRLLARAFAIGDLAYVIQDKGEIEIATSTLLKNLHATKFYVYETNQDGSLKLDVNNNPVFKKDDNGNNITINAFDALVDTGLMTPGIRKDVAMTEKDLEAIRARTYVEYLQHQGNYAKLNQTKFESGMIGMLAFFFRKYLVPFTENRFKGSFGTGDPKNWTSGQVQRGWWTAVADIFLKLGFKQGALSLMPQIIAEKTGKLETNEFYQIKAAQARREMMMGLIWTCVYMLCRSLVYDPDDKEKVKKLSWIEGQALRTLAKVSNESRSMLIAPFIGKGDDFIKSFASFTSAFNEGKEVFNGFENLIYYLLYESTGIEYMQELGYYQKKTARYEKGTPKVVSNFNKLFGIENWNDLIDPVPALKTVYQKK